MGKKNPLKEVIKGAADLAVAPIRETARIVGADGIVRGADAVKDFTAGIGTGAIDLANNEKGKQQKKADAASAEATKTAEATAAAETERTNAANYAASEADRMAAGSKSRTLLTGPAGLDDENKSITRRTLQAR